MYYTSHFFCQILQHRNNLPHFWMQQLFFSTLKYKIAFKTIPTFIIILSCSNILIAWDYLKQLKTWKYANRPSSFFPNPIPSADIFVFRPPLHLASTGPDKPPITLLNVKEKTLEISSLVKIWIWTHGKSNRLNGIFWSLNGLALRSDVRVDGVRVAMSRAVFGVQIEVSLLFAPITTASVFLELIFKFFGVRQSSNIHCFKNFNLLLTFDKIGIAPFYVTLKLLIFVEDYLDRVKS